MRFLLCYAIVLTASMGSDAAAQTRATRPVPFQKMIDCRAIREDRLRLACFDREVEAVSAAEAREDIVVIDRQRVRSARRSLFGLSVPDLGIFGGNESAADEEGFSKIEGKIANAAQGRDGKWTFRLDDGARWIQTDTRPMRSDPRPGQTIAIRKAALGSFLANVNKQTAIRVKRIN